MLDEDVVLQNADLGALAALADDHDALDGLTAGQELGLGDDRDPAAALLPALAAALLLRLKTRGALDGLDLVGGLFTGTGARLADLDDRALRVTGARLLVDGRLTAATATATAATAPGGTETGLLVPLGVLVALDVLVVLGVLGGLSGPSGPSRRGGLVVPGVVGLLGGLATATTAAAPAATARRPVLVLVVLLRLGVGLGLLGLGFGYVGGRCGGLLGLLGGLATAPTATAAGGLRS
nr:hypothetical protein [Streptomyces tsukubensis NRRL18488]